MGGNESTDRRGNNAGLAVVGAVIIVYCVVRLVSGRGSSSGQKTMKAPGRNYRIPRADFEGDPASYFRGLRK